MFKKMFGKDKAEETPAPAPAPAAAARAPQPSPPRRAAPVQQSAAPAAQPGAGVEPEHDKLAPHLSVGAMAWVQTCLGHMGDAAKVRESLKANGYIQDPDQTAAEIAATLAVQDKLVSDPLRDFKHSLWRTEREGVPCIILLSEATSDIGPVTFCAALFGAAREVDLARLASSLVKDGPMAAGVTKAADGSNLRRLFWRVPSQNVRALVACGPENVNDTGRLRALIAIAYKAPEQAAA